MSAASPVRLICNLPAAALVAAGLLMVPAAAAETVKAGV
jgi:hypothetical protein